MICLDLCGTPGLFGSQCLWIQGIRGVSGSCDLPLCNHIFLSDWEGQILDLEKEAILLFPWVGKDSMSPLITVNPCVWRGLDFDFHHLISFCPLNPTKGHYYPHCTDEETRVLCFAHDRKLHEPVLAHQQVLKSSDILFFSISSLVSGSLGPPEQAQAPFPWTMKQFDMAGIQTTWETVLFEDWLVFFSGPSKGVAVGGGVNRLSPVHQQN